MSIRIFWCLLVMSGLRAHFAYANEALYVQSFRKLYDGPAHHSDEGYSVAADGQGGCYSALFSYQPVGASSVARLVAYDGGGNVRWTLQATEPSLNDHIRVFRPSALQDVWLAYEADHLGSPLLHVIRIGHKGSVRFDMSIPLASDRASAYPPGLYVDANGNAYLAYGLGGAAVVAKIGPKGNMHWQKTIISSGSSVGTAIEADAQGIYVAGIEKTLAGGYFTAKLKHSGELVWLTQDAGAIGNTLGPAFLQRYGQGLFVAASPESAFGVPRYRISHLLAQTGAVLWAKDYRPASFTQDGEAVGLGVDQDGNAYVAGIRVQPQAASFVVKYAANGTRLWERTLAAGGGNSARGFVVGPSGNAFVGTISGILSGVNRQGEAVYFAQRTAYYRHLVADPSGNVFAIGHVFSKATGDDAVTVKLQPVPPSSTP